ncbi:helix-turn-helix transcriptional regulator [Clostridium grantii]|uniref:Helix-turn-helix domain-containing protein n=1 Tax=Clostridium grantii DSM 8605 TaxID=1121316 RepID=A0A1M5Y0Z5_9CLOT|nr:AraC family transcriptional regulator [Clostridium grantii]SHI05494.1 Helix-turn-helix domain-containing protein [Clostridium grantii DSM 8605]
MKKGLFKKKIFIFFLSIMLILMFAIVLLYYYNDKKVEANQSSLEIEQFANAQFNKIDLQLNIALNYLMNIKSHIQIEKFAIGDTLDFYNVLKIQNELKKNILYIDNLDYYIGITKNQEEALVITPFTTTNQSKYYNQIGISEDKQEWLKNKIKDMKYNREYLLVTGYEYCDESNDRVLNYILKDDYFGNGECVFIVTIKEKSLFSTLLEMNKGSWFINREDKIIAKHKNMDNESFLNEDEIINYLKSNNNSIEEKEFNLKGFKGIIVPSNVLDWKYIYVESKPSIANKILDIFIKLLIPYILLIIISIYITIKITKKLYEPINSMVNSFEEFTEVSEVDEFEFIKKKTNEMKLQNKRLEAMLLEDKNIINEKALKDLLLGIKDIHKAKFSDSTIPEGKAIVCILEIWKNEEDLINENIVLVKSNLRAKAFELTNVEFVNVDYKTCALIFNVNTAQEAIKIIKDAVEEVEENFEIEITAALGKIVDSYEKINESFKDANKIMEYKFALGQKFILTSEELKSIKDRTYYYPLGVENKLIFSVIEGNIKEVNTVITNLVEENFILRNLDNKSRKGFAFSLFSSINRILQELKEMPEDFFGDDIQYYDNFITLSNEKDIITGIERLFKIMIAKINEDKDEDNGRLADEMMNYIHENYHKDISLNDISEYLNLSVKYSSLLFKRVTGSNFKEILNKHRIDRAKEILEKNPKIKIGELANLVGYNSSNSFIRVFKKYVGISPGIYGEKFN